MDTIIKLNLKHLTGNKEQKSQQGQGLDLFGIIMIQLGRLLSIDYCTSYKVIKAIYEDGFTTSRS